MLLLHTTNRKYHNHGLSIRAIPVTLNDLRSTTICATFRTVLTDTARRAVPRRQLSFLLHLCRVRTVRVRFSYQTVTRSCVGFCRGLRVYITLVGVCSGEDDAGGRADVLRRRQRGRRLPVSRAVVRPRTLRVRRRQRRPRAGRPARGAAAAQRQRLALGVGRAADRAPPATGGGRARERRRAARLALGPFRPARRRRAARRRAGAGAPVRAARQPAPATGRLPGLSGVDRAQRRGLATEREPSGHRRRVRRRHRPRMRRFRVASATRSLSASLFFSHLRCLPKLYRNVLRITHTHTCLTALFPGLPG